MEVQGFDMFKLVETHYTNNFPTLVKKISFRLTKEEAEEIVQEAYYRALKYIHAFNPYEFEFQRWFSRILSNVRKDFVAEKFGRPSHVDIDERSEEFMGESLSTNYALMQVIQDEIFEVKDENHREILTLYFIFNYHLRDIVQIVDMKMGTVNQILTRFKARLRETYA